VPFASCAGAHGEERQLVLAETILERASNLQEIRDSLDSGEFDWLHDSIKYDTALIKWKNDVSPTDALPRLQNTRTILETIEFRSPKTIKEALWDYASEEGRGEVLWPLRVALSGQEKSPDPFTLAFILGPEKTLMRIQNACDKLSE
jgi:glutamyl/glutaminyl-tRNA synthetase